MENISQSLIINHLFRQEAIDHRRQRLYGEVVISQPVRHYVLTTVLAVATAVGLAYLIFGTYARTETVPGYLAPVGGLAQVHATRGGTVEKVMVAEGDRVVADQPLLALTLEGTGAGGKVGARLRTETLARLAELDRQITTTSDRYAQEAARLTDRRKGAEAELTHLRQRLAGERELAELTQDEADRLEEITRAGHAPRTELSRRKQQALSQAGIVRELERQIAARESDVHDVAHAADILPLEREERLSQLRAAEAELRQTLAELELSQGYVLVAPVAGRVAALQATLGQAASPAAPLVALVPDGAGMEVHLLIPSRAAGLIAVGQEVRLRIDAFPFQRFGIVAGTVTQISRAAYRPGDLLTPVPFTESVYRVTVMPEKLSVSAYGEARDLQAGMTLSADVVVDRRRFIDVLLDPLRAVRGPEN